MFTGITVWYIHVAMTISPSRIGKVPSIYFHPTTGTLNTYNDVVSVSIWAGQGGSAGVIVLLCETAGGVCRAEGPGAGQEIGRAHV